jgi:hypothetical protein
MKNTGDYAVVKKALLGDHANDLTDDEDDDGNASVADGMNEAEEEHQEDPQPDKSDVRVYAASIKEM